jgi:hypothetical protein
MNSRSLLLGNWNVQKAALKAKFPALTDEDLHYTEGDKLGVLEKMCIRLYKTKEELAIIIASL